MHKKFLFTLLILTFCTLAIQARAALRRTPKVYNALITTDDNLTSSRAYPVIQPTIHETGIPHYPFGPYNAYYNGLYSPAVVRFGQPIAPGLVPREQLPYPLPNTQYPPQLVPQPPPSAVLPELHPTYETYSAVGQNPTAPPQEIIQEHQVAATQASETEPEPIPAPSTQPQPQQQQQPVIPPNEYQNQTPQGPKYMPVEESKPIEIPNDDKLPIALNEYGLPPSLIPLQQQHPIIRDSNQSPLPPYIFNQFPLSPGFYDPLTGFRDQYLPPYEYSASAAHTYAIASAMAARRRQAAQLAQNIQQQNIQNDLNDLKTFENPNSNTEATETKPSFPTAEIESEFESIKNVSKLKNNQVPDVPPPPIPSGAKTKASTT